LQNILFGCYYGVNTQSCLPLLIIVFCFTFQNYVIVLDCVIFRHVFVMSAVMMPNPQYWPGSFVLHSLPVSMN